MAYSDFKEILNFISIQLDRDVIPNIQNTQLLRPNCFKYSFWTVNDIFKQQYIEFLYIL